VSVEQLKSKEDLARVRSLYAEVCEPIVAKPSGAFETEPLEITAAALLRQWASEPGFGPAQRLALEMSLLPGKFDEFQLAAKGGWGDDSPLFPFILQKIGASWKEPEKQGPFQQPFAPADPAATSEKLWLDSLGPFGILLIAGTTWGGKFPPKKQGG
jgi:hypothetical protein